MTISKYPIVIACVFIWIGFVAAISFMEAWLKFRAPGVTMQLGLSIGRLVFKALNRVELVLSIIIILTLILSGISDFHWKYLFFLIPFLILISQSIWLLPAMDARADMYLQGYQAPKSNLHFYYVGMEVIKTSCLLIFGLALMIDPK